MDSGKGLSAGTVLHGAYRIERILGQGGFGITYLAYEMRLERHVAIKEFFPKDFCDRESTTSQVTLGTGANKDFVDNLKAKFLREARYIAKLDHPGIIKIHTAFEENHTAYYVMDFIDGSTLSRLVKDRIAERKGPLPEKEALRYTKMAGEALEYLHRHSMNHFDVKPANILIRQADDRPILIDFGLSRQYDDSSQATATVMGMSQGYAPMEQYVAGGVREFSPQTDIYALAATLYFLLSGTAPPDAPSLAEQELMFPAQIPAGLIGPISKAMASRRLDRHGSVTDFLKDLDKTEQEQQNDDDRTQLQPTDQEETQLSQGRTEAQPSVSAEAEAAKEATKENSGPRKRSHTWIVAVAAAGIGLGGYFLAATGRHDSTPDPETVETASNEDGRKSVEGLIWESPLGRCVYTGTVLTERATGRQIPDGKGIARITGGDYDGCTYDGEFKNGVLEGPTTYTYRNGDTFEGTFINNEYSKGKYTIKASGEYFEGTYKDGAPDAGTWYDRNGNRIE